MSDPEEPKNYKSATQGSNKAKWTLSIKSEIENFYKCDVWKNFQGTSWMEQSPMEVDGFSRSRKGILIKFNTRYML